MRMPKMQVYLPDELYQQVKQRADELNVSRILQEALTEHLAQLDRDAALAEALAEYVAEFGEFTADELEARRAADDREADRNRALIRRWME
jgi:post-segregation antitoxin (ccd killing protein)